MKKLFSYLFCAALLSGLFLSPSLARATNALMNNLSEVATNQGTYAAANQNTIIVIAGTVVSTLLGLLGIIFIVLIIFAGISWMTAGGEEAKVEKAQKILKNAIIGLIVTASAYAIYYVIHLALMGQMIYDTGVLSSTN
jgi:hypothetical protein